MQQDERSERWKNSPILIVIVLLLLLISPLGAPVVGYALAYVCDIPWEGAYQCRVPQPLLDYFLPFTILPFAWVGPFLAILWVMLSFAIAIAAICYLVRAVWQMTMERL